MAGTRDAGQSRALGKDSAKVLPALAAMPREKGTRERPAGDGKGSYERGKYNGTRWRRRVAPVYGR